MTPPRRGVVLVVLGSLAAALAVFAALTGGIDTRIGGVAIRSRTWERPAILAAVLLASGIFLLRRALAFVPGRVYQALPALTLAWGLAASLVFGTFAAGGADSFGYISQAELLAHGRLTAAMPLHAGFDWPDIPSTLTPLAFTRGPEAGRLVPIYPPGLPLMMAPFTWIHPAAVFAVVPISVVLVLWCCLRLGRELGDPDAGVLAAALLSVSPTFLVQAIQPMSDVPVTACWLGALLLARLPGGTGPAAAGFVASLAILTRPNLAPLAAFVVLACATAPQPDQDDTPWTAGPVARRMALCVACMLPGLAALAAVQQVRYGSPLGSGYGSFEDLFALSNIQPNLDRYPRWLAMAHSPAIGLWLLAPLWFRSAPLRDRGFGWLGYGFTFAVVLAYLPYVFFRSDEWSYTRFLLPALPFMLLFAVGVVLATARRVTGRGGFAVTALLVTGLAGWCVYRAQVLDVFRLREGERKYPAVGRFVRDRLPQSALVLAAQHSGSVWYYSGRPTLRWDLLDRGSLDRALRSMRNAGFDPFLVVDEGEDEAFRRRFAEAGQVSVAGLAPIATIGNTTVFGFR